MIPAECIIERKITQKAKGAYYGVGMQGVLTFLSEKWSRKVTFALAVRSMGGKRYVTVIKKDDLPRRKPLWISSPFKITGFHPKKDEMEFARAVADMFAIHWGYTPYIQWRKPKETPNELGTNDQ